MSWLCEDRSFQLDSCANHLKKLLGKDSKTEPCEFPSFAFASQKKYARNKKSLEVTKLTPRIKPYLDDWGSVRKGSDGEDVTEVLKLLNA